MSKILGRSAGSPVSVSRTGWTRTPQSASQAEFSLTIFAGITQNTQNLGHTWPDVGRKLANGENPADSIPSVSAKNPAPTGILPTATPYNQGAWYSDPRMDNSYSMQWNFGVQRQLDQASVLDVNYVGSGNRRLPLGTFYNVALTPGKRSEARQRAPFPLFRANNYQTSWGRSNYHSLQAQYNRRFSKGLSFMLNYTWAKAIDIGCTGWFREGCSQQNPYNFNIDRSVAGIDLTHNLNFNWVYDLPAQVRQFRRAGDSWRLEVQRPRPVHLRAALLYQRQRRHRGDRNGQRTVQAGLGWGSCALESDACCVDQHLRVRRAPDRDVWQRGPEHPACRRDQ